MKKFKIVFLSFTLVIIVTLVSFIATTGKVFPTITAETLESKKVTIPADTKGKYTLVGLAYSQKAQEDLKTWFQPVYDVFIAKPDKPQVFDDSYDVNLYLILMFTGANEGMAATAKKKLQELDKELKPYVLIYKGDISNYKKELSLKDDKPYFYLLDAEGKIVHTVSGAYTEAKMDKIEEILNE